MPDEPASLDLPGLPSMVDHAGAEARRILGDCPRADDASRIAEAFAALAVHHSASGETGGAFRVLVSVQSGRARVEVYDAGERRAPASGNPGFGSWVRLVDRLADAWGHERKPGGSLWWAQVEWVDEEERHGE